MIFKRHYAVPAEQPRLRNSQGRYITTPAAGANPGMLARIFLFWRKQIDQHLLISFLQFLFNFFVSRYVKKQSQLGRAPSWYPRILGGLGVVGKIGNWFAAVALAYTSIGYLLSSFRERGKTLWAAKPSISSIPENVLSSIYSKPKPQFWEGFYKAGSSILPDSYVLKLIYVILVLISIYLISRLVFKLVLIVLHRFFDAATPTDLQTLRDKVTEGSVEALREIRGVGNLVIMIQECLAKIEQQGQLSDALKQGLVALTDDVKDIRGLEQRFNEFTAKVNNTVTSLSESSDRTAHTVAATLQAILKKHYEERSPLQHELINNEKFNHGYRIAKMDKGRLPGFAGIRQLFDPNAEYADNIAEISKAVETYNSMVKNKEATPLTQDKIQELMKKQITEALSEIMNSPGFNPADWAGKSPEEILGRKYTEISDANKKKAQEDSGGPSKT